MSWPLYISQKSNVSFPLNCFQLLCFIHLFIIYLSRILKFLVHKFQSYFETDCIYLIDFCIQIAKSLINSWFVLVLIGYFLFHQKFTYCFLVNCHKVSYINFSSFWDHLSECLFWKFLCRDFTILNYEFNLASIFQITSLASRIIISKIFTLYKKSLVQFSIIYFH